MYHEEQPQDIVERAAGRTLRNMKRVTDNPYDLQFDLLRQNLLRIDGIDQFLSAPGGMRFLEFITVRQYELNGLAALYKQAILPAINKNSVVQRKLWKQSRASKAVQLDEGHFREDKYVVIRLAYVQLFHLYESFINDLFPHCEQIVEDPIYQAGSLYSYITSVLGVDFKRPSYHATLKEVNYVANCVKHTNGLPKRTPVPERFKTLDRSLPIRIHETELYRDFNSIRELMGKVVIDVAWANQLLLSRSLTSAMEDDTLQRIRASTINVAESFMKQSFGKYIANFSPQLEGGPHDQ